MRAILVICLLFVGVFLMGQRAHLNPDSPIPALGIEFQEGDVHTDCSAFSATGGGIFYDDDENTFKKCENNTLTDLDLDTGGATDWDNIGDPPGNGVVQFANTAQTMDWNTPDTATTNDGMVFQFNHDASTDVTTQRGITISRVATAGTGTLEVLLQIDNNDTDGLVGDGISITTAAGNMTNGINFTPTGTIATAINASDPEIAAALDIGLNTIETDAGTITSVELDRLTGLANTIVTDASVVTNVDGFGLQVGGGTLSTQSTEAFLILQTGALSTNGALIIDTDGDGSLYDADVLVYRSLVDFYVFGAQAFPTDVDNVCLVYDSTNDQVEWTTTSCIAGGAGEWTTDSNVVNLVVDGDRVTVGSLTSLAKFAVDGDDDEVQMIVQGDSTQTAGNDLFVVEESDGTDKFSVDIDETVFSDVGSVVYANVNSITYGAGVVLDAGAATSLEIPNAAAPVITTLGRIALDTTDVPATDGSAQLIIRDGAEDIVLLGVRAACFDIEDLVAGDDDYAIWAPPYAVTIRGAYCYCNGTCTAAGIIHFEKNNAGSITQIGGATTTGDVACSNSSSALEAITDLSSGTLTLAAFEQLRFDTLTAPTATNTMNICWTYSIDRQ